MKISAVVHLEPVSPEKSFVRESFTGDIMVTLERFREIPVETTLVNVQGNIIGFDGTPQGRFWNASTVYASDVRNVRVRFLKPEETVTLIQQKDEV